MNWENQELRDKLKQGKVVVMPTDTIYGIVGSALNEATVERIYKVRKRAPERPCIILIGDINDLEKFSIEVSEIQREEIKKYWPGPVSIILDCANQKLEYLHRGTNTLAFRFPAVEDLRNLLNETGPLVAPSANTEGNPTAKDVEQARKYFGDLVDTYVDGGVIEGKASKLIQLHKDSSVTILRE